MENVPSDGFFWLQISFSDDRIDGQGLFVYDPASFVCLRDGIYVRGIMFQYFWGFGLAAVVALFYAVQSYRKKIYIGNLAGNLFTASALVNLTYLSRIYVDSVRGASVATSLYFISLDLLLFFAVCYAVEFTRPKEILISHPRIVYGILCAAIAIDTVLLLGNIRLNWVLVYDYDPERIYAVKYFYTKQSLFYFHDVLCYAMLAMIVLFLIWKAVSVPRIYRARFSNSVLVLLLVGGMNLLYVSGIWQVSIDAAVLIYGFISPVIYWNSFDYTSQSVLNSTRKMVMEYIGTPFILFDYEGFVADSNRDMRKLFPVLEDSHSRITMLDFLQLGAFRELQSTDADQVFEWKNPQIEGRRSYQCKFNCLRDERDRCIGHLLTMYDLEVERDMLTQLYSKHSFLSKLQKVMERGSYPITIVVCNANGIGLINDVYGWSKGNEMIRLTAQLLKENLPERVLLARMEDGDIAAAFADAEQEYAVRLFENVSALYREKNDTGIQSDLQYGVAVIRDGSKSMEEALHEAKESLQTKKLMNETSKKSSQLDSLRQTLTESDYETEEHVERTKEMAIRLGRELQLSDAELSKLALLAVLHDIGKIAIPHTILLKPGKLTDEEWEVMKSHTDKGYRIANASKELKPIAEYILHHHERWDGKGYPGGLDGENIPLLSRIITVVDSHDVMVHDRPYHKAMTNEAAVEELLRCSGTQFDPHIVTVFLKVLEKIL